MLSKLQLVGRERLRFRQVKIPEVLEFAEFGSVCARLSLPRLTLDFSKVESALPQQMVPLLVVCQSLRANGMNLSVVLPRDPELATLFANTGWAHAISPGTFAPVEWRSHHVPITKFGDPETQHATVSRVLHELIEHVVLDREFLRALEWSLNEITDNVLKHAQAPEGFVQVTLFKEHLAFAVGDIGRGIPNALRSAAQYRALSDVAALEHSTLPGVTNGLGQGNGLAGLRHIALVAKGDVQIFSHGAYGHVSGTTASAVFEPMREGSFPGTCVVLVLPTAGGWSLSEALRFQHADWEPIDLLETEYEDFDHPDVFVVRLAQERRGVGSREAGDALRQKCLNLLATGPDARLALDFDGLRMVASSFADALVGRLVVEIGQEAFDRRVAIVGMDDGISPIVSGAVSQRLRAASDAVLD